MYLNDLTSAQHNVDKLNKILADTFNHEVDLSEMTTDSLGRMLVATENKMMAIKESDLKYWENPQYNKLGLIQHQLKTYINEVAPIRTDGKKMKAKSESVVMEDDLEQAEVMLAAQELVDELQKMVEDLAEMQVQKLMPIVDAMKEQVGFEQAEAYNNSADGALASLLDQAKAAKEALENATLAARGQAPANPAPTDMAMDAPADSDSETDMAVDTDMGDDFDADDAAAGDENTIGRQLKGESAIADLEGRALSEKKFLESKDKLFKMVESGKMTQEHFINIISQLDEKDPYMGQNYNKFYGNQAPKNTPKTLPNTPPPPGDARPRAMPNTPPPSAMPNTPPLQGFQSKPGAKPKTRPDGTPFNRFAPPPTGPGGDQALPRAKPDRRLGVGLADPSADPRLQNKRGFTPGEQEPEDRLKNDRGFTPGKPEPGQEPGDRGFDPNAPQVPPQPKKPGKPAPGKPAPEKPEVIGKGHPPKGPWGLSWKEYYKANPNKRPPMGTTKKPRFPMRLAPGMRNTNEPPVIYQAGRRRSRET